MSKFVGKFRKNKNYNDDYSYDAKRHRNEHSEIKRLLAQQDADTREIYEDIAELIKTEEWDR